MHCRGCSYDAAVKVQPASASKVKAHSCSVSDLKTGRQRAAAKVEQSVGKSVSHNVFAVPSH